MSFYVTVNFKLGPALSLTVKAHDEDTAVRVALLEAPEWGFTGAAKSTTVRPA